MAIANKTNKIPITIKSIFKMFAKPNSESDEEELLILLTVDVVFELDEALFELDVLL